MATSGTVAFRPNIEEIITESFERCGLDIQTRTGDQAISARRSLNLLFSEWANRGINSDKQVQIIFIKFMFGKHLILLHID